MNDVDPSPAAPREPAPRPFAPEPAFRDSLSPLARACTKIRVLSCAEDLAETFRRISTGDSVMSLFAD